MTPWCTINFLNSLLHAHFQSLWTMYSTNYRSPVVEIFCNVCFWVTVIHMEINTRVASLFDFRKHKIHIDCTLLSKFIVLDMYLDVDQSLGSILSIDIYYNIPIILRHKLCRWGIFSFFVFDRGEQGYLEYLFHYFCY